MFEHQDNSSDGKLASQRDDEVLLNLWRAHVLETTGDGAQNLYRVAAGGILSVAAVQPGRNCKNDDDERVPEHRNKEEQPF